MQSEPKSTPSGETSEAHASRPHRSWASGLFAGRLFSVACWWRIAHGRSRCAVPRRSEASRQTRDTAERFTSSESRRRAGCFLRAGIWPAPARRFTIGMAASLVAVSAALAQTPGDADGDGLVTPLDASVASEQILGGPTAPGNPDCNGDAAVDTRDLVCIHRGIPTQIRETSPANGEADVGVSRESILQFTGPLDANSVTPAAIHAEFGGQTLQARLYLSKDHRSATLFYSSALPASARVRITVDGDMLRDEQGRAVDADLDFQPGGTATVEFDTLSLSTVPGTSVIGRVFATELKPGSNGTINVPLEGVTITVDGAPFEFRAVSDQNGSYRMDPAPAGRFFVHIDGRTASRGDPYEDDYYPYVGKLWETKPGQETTMMDMFLPLVPADTLHPVSATEDTTIEFPAVVLAGHPEYAGVRVTVPADSLFSDAGATGGRVGIAPVPPDRMPGPPPADLPFPIVLTVQSDGPTNFDRPAPVCFPNLPRSSTGLPHPPGAESGLWSFNHDVGEFQLSGPMVVTDDGRLVCTKPGVGIPAPGWHGDQPGCRGRGPKLVSPPPTPGPTCSQVPGHELMRLISALGKCLKEFGKLGKILDGLIDAIKLVDKLRESMGKAIDDYKNGRIGDAALRAQIAYWRTLVTSLKLLVEQFTSGAASPYAKTKAVVECLIELYGLLEPVCEAICFDPPDCYHWLLRSYCCRLLRDKIVLDAVKRLLDYIEYLKGVVNSAFNAIENILDALEAQLVSPRRQGSLPDPDVVALLDQLGPQIANIDAVDPTDVQAMQGFASTVAEASGQGGDISVAYQGVVRNTFLLLESEGFAQRMRADQAGAYGATFPPETEFSLSAFDPVERNCGTHYGISPKAGLTFDLHGPPMAPCSETDADSDGLVDDAEDIVGTDRTKPDTDDDGAPDGAEIDQGTNPLDGLPTQTGVIATADTPGTAVDVCAFNDLVAVADSTSGVSIYNAFNGLNPVAIARVDTPGTARAVACADGFIAVADHTSGLTLIDISNPATARIVRQFTVAQLSASGSVQAVAEAGRFVFAGTTGGDIVAVDLGLLAVDARVDLNLKIEDLVVEKDTLFAFTNNRLHSLRHSTGALALLDQVDSPSPIGINDDNGRGRLFVGSGIAYPVHTKGYNTIDVSDPEQMQLIRATNTAQFGWKQIVLNGSGLGIAAVDPIQGLGQGAQDVSVYDTRDPSDTDQFMAQLATPGIARSVTIFNGLAYVADHTRGLQVMNYLAFDSQRLPPGITLSANIPLTRGSTIPEGSSVRVTANVFDDVQVRNVEFHVDGLKVATDGNFPFEHRFLAPLRTSTKTSFTLRARASDTGGNATWTGEYVIGLSPVPRKTEED